MEFPCWDTFLWKLQRAEVAFPIWREELIGQQPRPAVLEVVSLLAQRRDAAISGTDTFDFVANILRILPREYRGCACVIKLARHQHGNLPFIFSLGWTWTGNLRTVDNAAFATG